MSAPTASPTKVIVFGPTGNVGSAAALAAREQGTTVYLAMRDPHKPIPSLAAAEERAGGGFERVATVADLHRPDTVRAAVAQTGADGRGVASRAFVYLAFGAADHMRGAIEALRDGGVRFVVFLSSFSVEGGTDPDELRRIPRAEFTAHAHAQVEANLAEVFGADGCGYVAVRPGYFASNLLLYRKFIAAAPAAADVAGGAGVVRMPYPQAEFDCIAPEDIGRVAGVVLARGQPSPPIYLAGPQRITQGDAIGVVVARVLGKRLRVESFADDSEAARFLEESYGLPGVGENLVRRYRDVASGRGLFDAGRYDEAVANIKTYGLKEPTSLEVWVEQNKTKFLGV